MLEVEIDGLPEGLDGLRIAHLSDFHLGAPSRGRVATERAVAWVAERQPDLVCITGDLVSHPRGVPLLAQLLGTLDRPYVVLGNHDVAVTRDPFSRAAELDGLEELAVLLRDEAVGRRARRRPDPDRRHRRRELSARERRGRGSSPTRPPTCGSCSATFPTSTASSRTAPSTSCWPGISTRARSRSRTPRRADHARASAARASSPGSYPAAGGVMHVSPGTGTTFVPIRFFARPEVTELVLRAADRRLQQSP